MEEGTFANKYCHTNHVMKFESGFQLKRIRELFKYGYITDWHSYRSDSYRSTS